MPWSPTLLVDGQTPGVTAINAIFNAARTYLNDLDRYALRRGAVNRFLAPSVVKAVEPTVVSHSDTQAHSYDRAVFGASLNYTTFGANGGSAIAATLGSGDRAIIGHESATGSNPPDCSVSLNSGAGYFLDGSGANQVTGILCLFNCDIEDIADGANANAYVMMCLQYKVASSATWITIDKSERLIARDEVKITFNSGTEKMWYDMSIRTLLTSAVLTNDGLNPAAETVTGIRAMVSLYSTSGTAVLTLGSFRLSAVPLLASVS